MSKTRMSLCYLAGYLLLGGAGLLFVPAPALRLLQATGDYGTVFPQLVGMMMLGLGAFVVQVIRHDLEALYPTTLGVRFFFLICLALLWGRTSDPLFLVLIAIVGLGFALTSWSRWADRRHPR